MKTIITIWRRSYPAAIAGFLLSGAIPLYANGYNRINEFFMPVFIIMGVLIYGAVAVIPAAVLYIPLRAAGRTSKGSFIFLYLGSFAGGEAGIAFSAWFAYTIAGPGWNSYHYTLYPWVIGGLSIFGGAVGYIIRKRSHIN